MSSTVRWAIGLCSLSFWCRIKVRSVYIQVQSDWSADVSVPGFCRPVQREASVVTPNHSPPRHSLLSDVSEPPGSISSAEIIGRVLREMAILHHSGQVLILLSVWRDSVATFLSTYFLFHCKLYTAAKVFTCDREVSAFREQRDISWSLWVVLTPPPWIVNLTNLYK